MSIGWLWKRWVQCKERKAIDGGNSQEKWKGKREPRLQNIKRLHKIRISEMMLIFLYIFDISSMVEFFVFAFYSIFSSIISNLVINLTNVAIFFSK